MVATLKQRKEPFGLVVTGEAGVWESALEQIVGPQWIQTYPVRGQRQLMKVVESGVADAAVLDDNADWELDILHLLRLIRQVDAALPVVIVTSHTERRWLEDALKLTAFSVVIRPLKLEELLRQVHRIMARLDEMLRQGP